MNPQELLASAQAIVNGDRQRDYGHPADNHGCTAALWAAYLSRKGAGPLTMQDVCLLNILQKISRLANTPGHEDSIRDIVGYALNMTMTDKTAEPPADQPSEPPATKPDAGEGYRLLADGELIQEGDEFRMPWSIQWHTTLKAGERIGNREQTYRRRVSPAEKKADVPPCKGECQSGEDSKCGDVHNYGWQCSRLKGHSGDHVACGDVIHAYHVWPQDDQDTTTKAERKT